MTFSELTSWAELESATAEQPDELIARCVAGDERALAVFYAQYAAYVYRLSYSLLQHREDSEEVLQDTFEYAFRRLDRYDPSRASVKTWLYQIAVSRCRNKRRRKWLPTFSLGQLLRDEVHDPHATAPDEAVMLNDRQTAIWEALGQLSPKLRETAVLRYYEAMTYPEIGAVLGIGAKTAESRMRLAHAALKDILGDLL